MSFLASIPRSPGAPSRSSPSSPSCIPRRRGPPLLPRYDALALPAPPRRHRLGTRGSSSSCPPSSIASAGRTSSANRSLGHRQRPAADLGRTRVSQSSVVGLRAPPSPAARSRSAIAAVGRPPPPSARPSRRTDDGMLDDQPRPDPPSGITLPVLRHRTAPTTPPARTARPTPSCELRHGYPGEADRHHRRARRSSKPSTTPSTPGSSRPPSSSPPPSASTRRPTTAPDIEGRPTRLHVGGPRRPRDDPPQLPRRERPTATTSMMRRILPRAPTARSGPALRTPETFGAAASLSGYDTQIEGQMTNQGDQYLADNTLSTMLANRTPDGMRIYAMAAGDDVVGGAYTALKMAAAVRPPDTVTTDVPPHRRTRGPPVARTHPDDARVVGILRPRRERGGRRPDRSDGPGLRGLRVPSFP